MPKEIALQDLLTGLDQLSEKDFSGPKVDQLLRDRHVSMDDLADYANFWSRTYARNLIRRTNEYELILLAWLPGQKTRIHDHGSARCWTAIVSGSLSFQDYAPLESLKAAPVPLGPPTTPPVGELVFVEDSIGMHSITNLGPHHALSLHLYAKPLEGCYLWNPDRGQFEWKKARYFTTPEEWQPGTESPGDFPGEEPLPQ